MTDHPAPNPNQPDALVEKARAEAEREYGAEPEDRGLTYPVGAIHQTRIGAYVRGYLAAAEHRIKEHR